jgi:uncharacterized membrane protein YccC
MKPIILSLALLPLVACAGGQEEDEHGLTSEPSVMEEGKESPNLAEAEHRLEQLDAQIGDIKNEVATQTTEVPMELKDLIAAIDEKRQSASEAIAALKDNDEVASVAANQDLQVTLSELQAAIDEAWERVRA